MEKMLLSAHLIVGVGYYHHLILRLQMEYDLDLVGVVDFAFVHNESISSYVSKKKIFLVLSSCVLGNSLMLKILLIVIFNCGIIYKLWQLSMFL